jgi:hypothetical protein
MVATWLGRGATPAAETVCPNTSRLAAANTHFSTLMASPLAAKIS